AVLLPILLAFLSSRADLYAVKPQPVRPGIVTVDWKSLGALISGPVNPAGGGDCRIHDSGCAVPSAAEGGALPAGSGSGGLAQPAAPPCRRGDRSPAERRRNNPPGGKNRTRCVRKALIRIVERESARDVIP